MRNEDLEKLYCMSILDRLSYDVSLLCVSESLKSIWVRIFNSGYSKLSIIGPGRSMLLEFEKKIVLVV